MGVVAMMLVLGGGAFAYRAYKENRPYKMWVPMPINPEMPVEKRDEIAKNLKEKLGRTEILLQISKDLGLPAKFHLASHDEAVEEISHELFVQVGEADGPMGKVPSINIGMNGKSKNKELSGEIAMRLMDDVWKILGVKAPMKKDPPPF